MMVIGHDGYYRTVGYLLVCYPTPYINIKYTSYVDIFTLWYNYFFFLTK